MLGADILPQLSIDDLDSFLLELVGHDKEIKSGVVVVGDAAAYALVWEFGNMRQQKKGPRTVRGTNPFGERVWLSSQAPHGWIRTNEALYWRAFQEELAQVDFSSARDARAMTQELEKHVTAAARKIRYILQAHVPRDSGRLADALQEVDPSDGILDVSESDYGAMEILGGGS